AVMLAVRKGLSGANLIPEVTKGPAPQEAGLPPPGARPVQAPLSWGGLRRKSLDEPRADAVAEEWVGERRTEVPVAAAGLPQILPGPARAVDAGVEAEDDPSRLPLSEGRAASELEQGLARAGLGGIDPRELLLTARPVGQVANTYLLVPVPMGLWIVDQHV